MHGNVHRADLFPLDPIPIGVVEIRQRDKVAVEHRITKIVVHHIERFAHPFGNLLDKAKWTGILANAYPIKGWIAEGDAPELVPFKLKLIAMCDTPLLDLERHMLRLCIELEVERVEHRVAIDRKNAVAGRNAKFGRQRARCDGRNDSSLT